MSAGRVSYVPGDYSEAVTSFGGGGGLMLGADRRPVV